MGKYIDGRTDRRRDRLMNGWMINDKEDGWMDGWRNWMS